MKLYAANIMTFLHGHGHYLLVLGGDCKYGSKFDAYSAPPPSTCKFHHVLITKPLNMLNMIKYLEVVKKRQIFQHVLCFGNIDERCCVSDTD